MAKRSRKVLKILWKKTPIGTFVDNIPYEWFEHDVDEDKRYAIYHASGEYATMARVKFRVSENWAILYYGGKNRKYNLNHDIDIGTTRVIFRDETRSVVYKVRWKDECYLKDLLNGKFDANPVRRFWFSTSPVKRFWVELTK